MDYSWGRTGSAHDALAFQDTAAARYPDWFFDGDEFAWADSAYPCNRRTIPVHKEPASFDPRNQLFDNIVSKIRVRSEHCIGVLKGRFQSLRGLRVTIKSNEDHIFACHWISAAIILHNFIIDFEGLEHSMPYLDRHGAAEEVVDMGGDQVFEGVIGADDEAMHQLLVEEINFIRS